jgi:NADH:ubiquinone oxidoreductase subunit K
VIALVAGVGLFALGLLGILTLRGVVGLVVSTSAITTAGIVTLAESSTPSSVVLALVAVGLLVGTLAVGRGVRRAIHDAGAEAADELDDLRW